MTSWEGLAERLRGLNESPFAPDDEELKAWTRFVLEGMSSDLPEGVVAYPKYAEDGSRRGEFLVDLVWSVDAGPGQDPSQWKNYAGLILALECEWGGTEEAFWEDFAKLVDVRAKYRVFVGALQRQQFRSYRVGDGLARDVQAFLRGRPDFAPTDFILVALWEKTKAGPFIMHRYSGDGTCEAFVP
ncbi:MAG: hypothetical protein H6834_04990 [Planctomycetes bacterium]|nr:hypothetical protein [Planctomycetota bacterium]